jgi:hypothetical protein
VGRAHASWPAHFHLTVQHMCWITNTWQGHIHAHFLQGECKVLCLCEQLPYKHVYRMGEHWVCIKGVPNGCLCAIWTVWFWDSSSVEKGIMLHIEGVEPKPYHSHRACHKCGSCSNAWRVSIFMNSSNPCSSKSLSLWAIASLTCSLLTQLWQRMFGDCSSGCHTCNVVACLDSDDFFTCEILARQKVVASINKIKLHTFNWNSCRPRKMLLADAIKKIWKNIFAPHSRQRWLLTFFALLWSVRVKTVIRGFVGTTQEFQLPPYQPLMRTRIQLVTEPGFQK